MGETPIHDDVIKGKHFPRYLPYVRGIHRWIPRTKASNAELWCFLWSAPDWIHGWVNNREACDLRRHRAHYDIIVMLTGHYWGTHMTNRHFVFLTTSQPGAWFNIKMSSYQYRTSHCGDKTIVGSFYLHKGISYTSKMASLYWISSQDPIKIHRRWSQLETHCVSLAQWCMQHIQNDVIYSSCKFVSRPVRRNEITYLFPNFNGGVEVWESVNK